MDVVSLPEKRKTAKQVNGERYTVTREAKNCKASQEWSEKCYPRIAKLRSKSMNRAGNVIRKLQKYKASQKQGNKNKKSKVHQRGYVLLFLHFFGKNPFSVRFLL